MKKFNPFVLAFDCTKMSLRVDVWEKSKKLGEVSVILNRETSSEIRRAYQGAYGIELTKEEEQDMLIECRLIAIQIWE